MTPHSAERTAGRNWFFRLARVTSIAFLAIVHLGLTFSLQPIAYAGGTILFLRTVTLSTMAGTERGAAFNVKFHDLISGSRLFGVWFGTACLVAVMAVLVRNIRLVKEPDQRRRSRLVILGTLVGAGPLTAVRGMGPLLDPGWGIRTRVASRRLREVLPVLRLDSDSSAKLGRRLKKVTTTRRPSQLQHAWIWALEARVVRRAAAVRSAIEAASIVYVPDRIHDIRIAVTKLRCALELARSRPPSFRRRWNHGVRSSHSCVRRKTTAARSMPAS
jgi:hypothetical protein